MDYSPQEMIFLFIGFGGFALVLVLVQLARANRENSGASGDILHIEDLENVALLSRLEEFDVGFWRQSNEIYKIGSAGVSRDLALRELMSTFRKAKIEFVRINKNSTVELDLWRASHGGRGVREGRKLGGASIKKVIEQSREGKLLEEYIKTAPQLNVDGDTTDTDIENLFEPIRDLADNYAQASFYLNSQSQRLRVCREVIKNFPELFSSLSDISENDDNLFIVLSAFVKSNGVLSREVQYAESIEDQVWHWFSQIKAQNPEFKVTEPTS